MSKLIIAEKPSVARDIARVIGGAKAVKNGGYTYYDCGDFLVANARGHFIRLAEPEEYDAKFAKRNLTDLPIVPQKFKLKPIDDCKSWLSALSKLIKSDEVTSLICATDAGREGEVIFGLIYNFLGCKKPFQRLWISSMTDESISAGLANLLPGNAKENLYRAGIARMKTDWLIGMNLSRLYSCLYSTNYSVGRVQTAAVNMIVLRDREILDFKKKQAENVKNICAGKTVTVTKADTKRKSENRPLLHSLTSLQIEANEKLGLSADDTLKIAQKLYEAKLLSYPRTDSNYITDDMPGTVTEIVKSLVFFNKQRVGKLLSQGLNFDKRVVDNSKVSDHHALIPTNETAKIQSADLSENERAVLYLVIERLLTALDLPYFYDETICVFECQNHTFGLRAKVTAALGWREYARNAEADTAPKYSKGGTFIAEDLQIKGCETEPPKKFTESTLLKAMENIDRRINDRRAAGGKFSADFLKSLSLGTPATRAAIIERILKQTYVERKNKNIISTERGRIFIDSVPEEVKSVEMTADMEQILSDIEKGAANENAVLDETVSLINFAIQRENNIEHENRGERNLEAVGVCPRCGGAVFEGKKNFYCENFPWIPRNASVFSACGKRINFSRIRKKPLPRMLCRLCLKKGTRI